MNCQSGQSDYFDILLVILRVVTEVLACPRFSPSPRGLKEKLVLLDDRSYTITNV